MYISIISCKNTKKEIFFTQALRSVFPKVLCYATTKLFQNAYAYNVNIRDFPMYNV